MCMLTELYTTCIEFFFFDSLAECPSNYTNTLTTPQLTCKQTHSLAHTLVHVHHK